LYAKKLLADLNVDFINSDGWQEDYSYLINSKNVISSNSTFSLSAIFIGLVESLGKNIIVPNEWIPNQRFKIPSDFKNMIQKL